MTHLSQQFSQMTVATTMLGLVLAALPGAVAQAVPTRPCVGAGRGHRPVL